MPKPSKSELMLVEIAPTPAPAKKAAGKPGPKPRDAAERARDRCCKAFDQAYYGAMEEFGGDPDDTRNPNFDDAKFLAQGRAKEAYRRAITLPADYDSTRGFIVAICYGVLIGALSEHQSSQLLYAAQVATSLLNRAPKSEKP